MTVIQPRLQRLRKAIRFPSVPRRRLGAVIVVALALASFGIWQFSTKILVAETPTSTANFVFIADLGCTQCYEAAADQAKSPAVAGVLLHANEPRRLVAVGAMPPFEVLARQKLLNIGVAPESIAVIKGVPRSDWETARLLNDWLMEHPGKRVRILCDRFTSQRWSFIINRTLAASTRTETTIEGIVDPRYDETNWWRNRTGIKTYFHCLFRIAYARFHGEDPIVDVDWSPEKYEALVVK
jgi:hypothetical protein